MPTLSLDLGCGRSPKNIFGADKVYGIDYRDDVDKNIVKADLVIEKIPFQDDFFNYVTAHDFIEHIPRLLYIPHRINPFVELMSEIWRVLVVGGRFYSSTPAFPHSAAFQDPTHVNIITEHTFPCYFDDEKNWGRIYGFRGAFKIINQQWSNAHLISLLEKVPLPRSFVD